MDQNLLIVIAVFVFVAAVALCIQAGLLFGIYRSARTMEEKASTLLPKVDALVESRNYLKWTKELQVSK